MLTLLPILLCDLTKSEVDYEGVYGIWVYSQRSE
jgi:hypothetical protein